MAVTLLELFHLESALRTEAERLRFRWPDAMLSDPTVPPDTKIHVQSKRALADDFDQVGNLLCGLQADWEAWAPKLRAGYLAMQLAERVEPPAEDAA